MPYHIHTLDTVQHSQKPLTTNATFFAPDRNIHNDKIFSDEAIAGGFLNLTDALHGIHNARGVDFGRIAADGVYENKNSKEM